MEKAAKAQDSAAFKRCFLQYPGASPELLVKLESYQQDILNGAAKTGRREVVEEKVMGDCAVVLANDAVRGDEVAAGVDAAYLLQQNGQCDVRTARGDGR